MAGVICKQFWITIVASMALEAAARNTAYLTTKRYRGGAASFLESLEAQRSLVGTRLLRASNMVALYRTLSGDDFSGTTPTSQP